MIREIFSKASLKNCFMKVISPHLRELEFGGRSPKIFWGFASRVHTARVLGMPQHIRIINIRFINYHHIISSFLLHVGCYLPCTDLMAI